MDPVEATVIELLPRNLVRVRLASSQKFLLAHAAGVKETNFVRLRPGDAVMVAVSQQDPTRGRILSVSRKS